MKITQLTDWKLAGYWPYAPLQSESMETGMTLIPQTPWIDAKVPGSVQNDLLAAGLIEDPYYEMNSIKAEWVDRLSLAISLSEDEDPRVEGEVERLINEIEWKD